MTRTYPLGPKKRRRLYLGMTFFAGMSIALVAGGVFGDDGGLTAIGVILGMLTLPLLIYLAWHARRPRLLLSPAGIEVRGIGAATSATVPWPAIQRLRLKHGSEGLVLNQPLYGKMTQQLYDWRGLQFRGAPFYDEEQQDLMGQRRYVPIDGFGEWFERGDLRAAIASFAPGLTENFARVRKAADAVRRRDARIVWIVSAVTAIAMAGAIGLALTRSSWSVQAQQRFDSVARMLVDSLLWLVVAALLLHVANNAIASVACVRERKWGMALVWSGVGLLQVLLVLALIGGS